MTDAAANNPHRPLRHRGVAYWWRALVGILLVILGLLIGGGGAWLIALGGSWYYLPAGAALLLAGILLLAGNMAGVWLYVLTWLATLAWAYWEVGLDGWALMPRVLAPTIILIFVLLAVPAFRDIGDRGSRNAAYVTSLLLPVIALGAFGFLHINALAQSQPAQSPAPAAQPAPNGVAASQDAAIHQVGNDWPVYGGSELATRYSPLNQVTASNVSKLTRVWSFHTGDMPSKAAKDMYSPENTPLEIGGHLYACSAKNILISADAKTGKEEWRYDPKVSDKAIPYGASCRGVAYFAVPGAGADQACATRIIVGTLD